MVIEVCGSGPDGPLLGRRGELVYIFDSAAEATAGVTTLAFDAKSVDVLVTWSDSRVRESPGHLVTVILCLPVVRCGLVNITIGNSLLEVGEPLRISLQLAADAHLRGWVFCNQSHRHFYFLLSSKSQN